MPNRSRSGVASKPARVVAPTRVKAGRSMRTLRADGPSPMIRSSWKSSIAGIQHFLDGRLQAVDLVDEQHVARLQVGQDGGQVAGALDHRAGGGAEPDPQFAGDDLGERGLAEARRAVQQHVVQRLAAGAGGLDEDAEVFAGGALADELRQGLRAEAGLGGVLGAAGGGDGAVVAHGTRLLLAAALRRWAGCGAAAKQGNWNRRCTQMHTAWGMGDACRRGSPG